MDIDPRLRSEPSQGTPQAYSSILPPPNTYPQNAIRLPPPPSPQQQLQHQQQQQQQQQPQLQLQQQHHHGGLPQWPQEGHPYYALQQGQQPHGLPPPGIHHPHHDPSMGASQQSDGGPNESKRPRACEACRGLKVRCEPDPAGRTCRRCAKAGRNCIVTAPSRKRQKKTDSRVAELEKKIDALTASLHATKGEGGVSDSEDDESYDEEQHPRLDSTKVSAGVKRRLSQYPDEETPDLRMQFSRNDYMEMPPSNIPSDSSNIHPMLMAENTMPAPPRNFSPVTTFPNYEDVDVVDRNIVDGATASAIFYHYTKSMAAHLPIVVFPADTAAGTIRKTKPTLFLAILSVASGQDHPHLQRIFSQEISRIFADRITCKGEKSVEFIQALQVSAIWYWPENDKDTRYYQLIDMAATMAVDLDMEKQASTRRERMFDSQFPRPNFALTAKDPIEYRRAWLGCYILSANAAMGSRRGRQLMKWDSYMKQCHNVLETSEEALASDEILCQRIKLQRHMDNVTAQISWGDSSVVSPSGSKTQPALDDLDKYIKDWSDQKPKLATSSNLVMEIHSVHLYAYGIPMHARADLGEGDITFSKAPASVPQGALAAYLASVLGIFDTFLAFSAQDVRTLPVLNFVRVAYASIILVEIQLASTLQDLTGDDLHVEKYLGRLVTLLRQGAMSGKSRPAHNFSMLVDMIQNWYERQKDKKAGGLRDSTNDDSGAKVVTPDGQDLNKSQPNGDVHGVHAPSTLPQRQQQSHRASAMGQTPLHLLSEVAMGNSGSNGSRIHNGGGAWYDHSTGQGEATTGYTAEYYPPSSGPSSGLRGMPPGFEQALQMTLWGGDFNYKDHDGFLAFLQGPLRHDRASEQA